MPDLKDSAAFPFPDAAIEKAVSPNGTRTARAWLWAALVAGLSASLYVAVHVANGTVVIGSEAGGFVYRYSQPFPSAILWTLGIVTATVVMLCLVPPAVARRHSSWLVCLWLLVAPQEQALLRAWTPFTFGEIFASDTANSFYSAAQRYSAGALLRHFHTLRPSLPLHAQSNMPGKVLFVSGLWSVTAQASVQAWLVVAASNVAGVFLYLLVLDVFADTQMALFSLVLYLFVPARLYFFPLLNTVTPLFALASLWLFVRSIRTSRAVYPLLLGCTLYVMLLFDPIPLVLGLLGLGLVWHSARTGSSESRTIVRQAARAIAAFVAVYVVFVAAFGFDLIGTFNELRAAAADFNLAATRPYRIWIGQNLLDFAFGVGVCQVVLFGATMIDAVRRPVRPRLMPQPIAVVTFSLAAILVVLDLLGANRGEVTRLWVFLACLWQIPAAYVCAGLNSRLALTLLLAVTLLQDAVGTALIGFVVP